MKKYRLRDIYGDNYYYKCDTLEEAKECFKAENGNTLKMIKKEINDY